MKNSSFFWNIRPVGAIVIEIHGARMPMTKELLFDGAEIDGAIQKITDAICADFDAENLRNLALIGIQEGGVPLALRIAKRISAASGVDVDVGTLDISMYRDDFGTRPGLPMIRETSIPFDVNRRVIVLTDDVLQSGRSVRAALDAINDYGRPAMIRLAALIDRGLREYPIQADYVGKTADVGREWRVDMEWLEFSGSDAAYKMKRV